MTTGLGKITDFVRERFNGKKPDKYNEFIANFETGVLTLEIPIHKQCYLLMSLLERTPNDVCSKFIATYKGLNPNVDSNNRQTRDAAHSQMLIALKAHLAGHPSVVGTRPADHLLEAELPLVAPHEAEDREAAPGLGEGGRKLVARRGRDEAGEQQIESGARPLAQQ